MPGATATATCSSSRAVSDQPRSAVSAPPPPCPFCGGKRTEVMSLFGSHASLTTCWCEDCRSPFEFLRWREADSGNMDPAPGVE